MRINQPVIKWSGSKRSQAEEILKYFPREIDVYYEPFIGGGSIMKGLLNNKRCIRFNRIVCSDLNQDLINLWNAIKNEPQNVSKWYEILWTELNKDDDKERKKKYFNEIRERYNKEHNSLDFMFINRTCYNGLIRYNSKGEFNTSFHINRDGIRPDKLEKIIQEWSGELNDNNVEFKCCSFVNINPNENDFCYFDPPYENSDTSMYFGKFDNKKLFEWLKGLKCKWIMSYDGKSGNIDNTYAVPKELYNEHLYIKSGNSSFKRMKDNNSIVYESLYLKR